MNRPLRFLPLLILIAIVGALAWRLSSPPDEKITSKMVGQPVPAFKLTPAIAGKPGLSSADLASGQPRLINVFASWCVPCIAEAPLLVELRRQACQSSDCSSRPAQSVLLPPCVMLYVRSGWLRSGKPRPARAGSSGFPNFIVDLGHHPLTDMGRLNPATWHHYREWEAAK